MIFPRFFIWLAVLTQTCLWVAAPSGAQVLQFPANHAPIEARGGAVMVTLENSRAVQFGLRRLIKPSIEPSTYPVLGPKKNDPAHQLLRRLVVQGKAAGNHGDLYENRDRDHSRLPLAQHPQLTEVLYGQDLRQQNLDYGVALTMLFDAPLIGNSSTALTSGPHWRSQPRFALTTPGGPARLYENYRAGQIHVYPEHRDHDLERGDLFPANTPYMLISQGSSGSDRAHLEALVMILAAFQPETKAFLKAKGLLAPTVQMVYRRARVGVRSRAAYLSGAAHPSVFDGRDIALARMVGLANAIKPNEVPPLVQLQVLEESVPDLEEPLQAQGVSEQLFDTPSAIARIWRSRSGRRSMIVSAAETQDPNGRDLTFTWVVLRGDRDRVRITPVTPDGRYAQIDIEWQEAQPVPGAPGLLSARIDIGVFANNGVHDSAPAFVSVLLPRHEERRYEETQNGLHLRHLDRWGAENYSDPMLFPEAP